MSSGSVIYILQDKFESKVEVLWLRYFDCLVLICMCDSAQPAELPR